ncbi:MAG: glycosyltransferase [Thermoplasmata archaeon]
MGSESSSPPLISVVITVKNEGRHLRRLLESLIVQEPPFEVIVVDALSRDATFAIAEEFARDHPGTFRAVQRFGSRGIGRNAGVALARGEFIAFTDGDCFADSQWLRAMRDGFRHADVVAGRTVAIGAPQYGLLERVELYQRGNDVTFPSCNLGYRRPLFEELHGFDPRFITAEDIDLNLRAVHQGARLLHAPAAIIYHEMRTTLIRFLYQAFWNGYGRKQLTEKHGTLWGSYRYRRLLENHRTVIAWARLSAALTGYFTRVLTGTGGRLTPRVPSPPPP